MWNSSGRRIILVTDEELAAYLRFFPGDGSGRYYQRLTMSSSTVEGKVITLHEIVLLITWSCGGEKRAYMKYPSNFCSVMLCCC